MEYGDNVRVVNENNCFVGLLGTVSIVAGDLIIVDSSIEEEGSFSFYIDELELINQ